MNHLKDPAGLLLEHSCKSSSVKEDRTYSWTVLCKKGGYWKWYHVPRFWWGTKAKIRKELHPPDLTWYCLPTNRTSWLSVSSFSEAGSTDCMDFSLLSPKWTTEIWRYLLENTTSCLLIREASTTRWFWNCRIAFDWLPGTIQSVEYRQALYGWNLHCLLNHLLQESNTGRARGHVTILHTQTDRQTDTNRHRQIPAEKYLFVLCK